MNEIVIDASVLLKWFRSIGESYVAQARSVRKRFESGSLRIIVPPLLFLEVLNIAARRWLWDSARLTAVAQQLDSYRFEVVQPDLVLVAAWASSGLTAYDACYVALAEMRGTVVITEDEEMLVVGGAFTRALANEPLM